MKRWLNIQLLAGALGLGLGCRDNTAVEQACPGVGSCVSSMCVADLTVGYMDGDAVIFSCVAPPNGAQTGTPCRHSQECSSGLCLLAGYCAEPCVASMDCESGWCAQSYVRGDAALYRAPVCARRAPDELEPLGDPFLIPEGDTSLDLPAVTEPTEFVLVPRGSAHLAPRRLLKREASESVLFDFRELMEGGVSPPINPLRSQAGPLTIKIPSGVSAVSYSSVGYRLFSFAEAATEWELFKAQVAPSGKKLNLQLLLFNVDLGRVEDRASPLGEAMERLSEELENAGLELGQVGAYQVPGLLAQRYSSLPQDEEGYIKELGSLLSLSRGSELRGVHLFFVQRLGDFLALTPSIPGPTGVHGSTGSGIALASDTILETGGAQLLSRVLWHELGHFLGLFHTSELGGQVFEPLPDTPECRIDNDANSDGVLTASECENRGADNLMFWSLSGDQLTSEQIHVLWQSRALSE